MVAICGINTMKPSVIIKWLYAHGDEILSMQYSLFETSLVVALEQL